MCQVSVGRERLACLDPTVLDQDRDGSLDGSLLLPVLYL